MASMPEKWHNIVVMGILSTDCPRCASVPNMPSIRVGWTSRATMPSCCSKYQLLLSCTGLLDVDCREQATLGELAVKVDFTVAGAFEFLEYDFIHTASRFDECR